MEPAMISKVILSIIFFASGALASVLSTMWLVPRISSGRWRHVATSLDERGRPVLYVDGMPMHNGSCFLQMPANPEASA